MIAWIKSLGSAAVVAVVGFLAFMAAAKATRHRQLEQEWKDRAVADQESDVAANVDLAKAARARAKAHGEKAKAAEKKTKERVHANSSREPTMSSITSKWRAPKPD
jgi:hypothetical protein